jgi:hypothetical protein
MTANWSGQILKFDVTSRLEVAKRTNRSVKVFLSSPILEREKIR